MHIDKKFARRIERNSSKLAETYINIQKTKVSNRTAKKVKIADGFAFIYPDAAADSKVIGLGLERSVREEEIIALEKLFDSENIPAQLIYCPFADPSLGKILTKRGWTIYEWTQVLVKDLCEDSRIHKTLKNVNIFRVERSDIKLWTETIVEGFRTLEPKWIARPEKFVSYPQIENVQCLLVEYKGKAAAAGAMLLQDDCCVMLLAATKNEFRNKGIHKELIKYRAEEAVASNCDFALYVCQLGSVSHLNAQKTGFIPAYCRPIMRKV